MVEIAPKVTKIFRTAPNSLQTRPMSPKLGPKDELGSTRECRCCPRIGQVMFRVAPGEARFARSWPKAHQDWPTSPDIGRIPLTSDRNHDKSGRRIHVRAVGSSWGGAAPGYLSWRSVGVSLGSGPEFAPNIRAPGSDLDENRCDWRESCRGSRPCETPSTLNISGVYSGSIRGLFGVDSGST